MAAWRYVIATTGLNPIADITRAMHDKTKSFRLNRPAQLSFRIASDDTGCATLQPDGFPAISSLRRVIIAYRHESSIWIPRFAGHVWQVQDSGDEDAAWTHVTCFDPLQRMSKRQARIHDGPNSGQLGRVTFSAIDAALIGKFLVDDTNLFAGESGLTTTGGTFEPLSDVTAEWDRKSVSDCLIDLSSQSNGFDMGVTPALLGSGAFARFNIYGRLGTTLPNVTFGWGVSPFNVLRMENLEDPVSVANRVTSLGSSSSSTQLTSTKEDEDSLDDIGAWEDVAYYNDIPNQTLLDNLTQGEIDVRKVPRKALKIYMRSEADAEPFVDYYLGDTVTVVAHERLRGGFNEQRRIFGFDISVSDEGVEKVEQVYVEEEA